MAEKGQKRGLGSGLGALFGDDMLEEDNLNTMEVAIEKVEPRKDQPRQYFEETSLEDLADSIAQFGIIQAITVRKLEDGYYQIIAGERRWRAARIAGLKKVPIRVIDADDKRAMELAMVENLQRENLNPIEEAKGYYTLMEIYGMTQEEASQSVGKSRSAVANSLRLLSLSPRVMAMVEDGDIQAGHARAVLAVKDEAEQTRLASMIQTAGMSVRESEKLIRKYQAEKEALMNNKLMREKKPLDVDYVAEMEQRLTYALSHRVHIKDGKKGGKIEIEYYGKEDRENLFQVIMALKNIY